MNTNRMRADIGTIAGFLGLLALSGVALVLAAWLALLLGLLGYAVWHTTGDPTLLFALTALDSVLLYVCGRMLPTFIRMHRELGL